MPGISRRAALIRTGRVVLGTLGMVAIGWPKVIAPQGVPQKTRLILLGTGGGPRLTKGGRSKSATLIVVNGVPYVVDCGEGVARQLVEAGLQLNTLRNVLITHHHSDHNLDLGNLMYNAWISGLNAPIHVYGPPPIRAMVKANWELNKFDIETRMADEGRPDLRRMVDVHEFTRPGMVLQNTDVKVTAARVRHPPITQAYGYRFDAADRSIVISGDTAFSPELVELARGADVLVHEVMDRAGIETIVRNVTNATTLREHLMASHTLVEDVGKVAAAAGVKTVVLSHFVPADDKSITDAMWTEGVRKHFSGRIIVGRDLMEI
jgi:ribonuclease BN (tRNA processing enzyme)